MLKSWYVDELRQKFDVSWFFLDRLLLGSL
jgi:hypothetical protein